MVTDVLDTTTQTDARAAPPRSDARKIKKVLLATDLTPTSDAATEQAIELAASLGARLLVANVIDQDRPDGGRALSCSGGFPVDQQRASREGRLLTVVEWARTRGL